MASRSQRPRRPASQPKIRALRLFGWRYSFSREAWVHRAFKGRVGPVFIDHEPEGPSRPLTEPDRGAFPIPEEARRAPEVLAFPSRALPILPGPRVQDPAPEARAERAPERVAPAPVPAAPAPPAADRVVTRVHVALSDSEEPRLIAVDGRPPRLAPEPAVATTSDGVGVPMRPAQATG